MPSKDFKNAMNKLTNREVVLRGEKIREGQERPFGEDLREELERETQNMPIGEVAVNHLSDNPFQHLARPSVNEAAMEELVNSIQQNGFYGALLARRKRGLLEEYELAFGHRRKEAAKRAGLTTLPVRIVDLSDAQMARIMASENFSREDLTPTGEASIIGHLYDQQNLSIPEIARTVGKGEGWVKLRLGLYQAPPDIRGLVEKKPETLGHVRLLLQVDDPAERTSLIDQVVSGKLTREKLEKHLKSSKGSSGEKKQKKHGEDPQVNVKNITDRIQYPNSDLSHNQYADSYGSAEEISEGRYALYINVEEPKNVPEALSSLLHAMKGLEKLVRQDFNQLTEADEFLLEDILARLAALKNL